MNVASSAKSNIALSMVAKLISIGVAVMSVPTLLQLLTQQEYGTWVTLTSLLAWIALLDLGVGNSVRNSVGGLINEASAPSVRQEFVAFFRLLTLIGVAAAAAAASTIMCDWVPIFQQNRAAALTLYLPILLVLPLMLGAGVLQGASAVGMQSVLQSAGGWLFFVFIATAHRASSGIELIELATAWSCFYVLSIVVMFLLAMRHLKLSPSVLVAKPAGGLPRGRLKVGLSFFVLQLSSLALYSLGNVITYQGLGSSEVARYDVLNKIFQVGLGFFTIFIGVLWTEISRLRAQQDAGRMRTLYARALALAIMFAFCALVLSTQAPDIVTVWTSGRIDVTATEAISVAALVSIQAVAYVGAVFMNAFEQIRLQVVLSWVSIALMLPLSNLFLAMEWGIRAVPLAAAALTLLPMVLCNARALALIAALIKSQRTGLGGLTTPSAEPR